MDQSERQKLEMRIVELENRLKELSAGRQPQQADISPEEIQAYLKVRDMLRADWGEFCGINDCMKCVIVRCWGGPIVRCRCDVECSCGPCGYGGGGGFFGGGGGRFGGLGG